MNAFQHNFVLLVVGQVFFINALLCLTGRGEGTTTTTTAVTAFVISSNINNSNNRRRIGNGGSRILLSYDDHQHHRFFASTPISSPTDADESSSSSSSSTDDEKKAKYSYDSLSKQVLQTIESVSDDSRNYAEMFGLSTTSDAAFHALFSSIRQTPDVTLGLKGSPFVLRHDEMCHAFAKSKDGGGGDGDGDGEEGTTSTTVTGWPGYFTMVDLEKAVTDDFLDAVRGSTANRKGWQITGM